MKVVDTKTLKAMVRRARRQHLSRLMDKSLEARLDPRGMHVLSQPVVHNDAANIRCTVCMIKIIGRDTPLEGTLDFDWNDWNRIPEHKEQEAAAAETSNDQQIGFQGDT